MPTSNVKDVVSFDVHAHEMGEKKMHNRKYMWQTYTSTYTERGSHYAEGIVIKAALYIWHISDKRQRNVLHMLKSS